MSSFLQSGKTQFIVILITTMEHVRYMTFITLLKENIEPNISNYVSNDIDYIASSLIPQFLKEKHSSVVALK